VNSEIPFNTLGLSSEILETIEKKGFRFATEIQAKSIPIILEEDHDIVGIAQTGTGKTAAFGLPLIDRINANNQHVKCIILTPTRELAMQVTAELDSFKGSKRIKSLAVYGGQSISLQIKVLKRGIDIVVGTPGRVMDMINRNVLKLANLDYFILDEADEMLKMGFIDDIEQILQGTPDRKRVFLYSATMPPKIQNLSKKYMKEQVVLKVQDKDVRRDNIQQIYYRIKKSEKQEAIKNIIELSDEFHGIIFCQTKVIVNELSDELKREKLDADCIHGDISQMGREKILKKFKTRKINILIATDVAARGLDIDDLTHVINYSLPMEIDSYVHRIGRTGRAGKQGIALTFIDHREEYKINRIKRETKNEIVMGKLPSSNEMLQIKQKRLIQKLEAIIQTKDTSFYANISKNLVQSYGDTKVISALLYQINGAEIPVKTKKLPFEKKEEVFRQRDRKSTTRKSDGRNNRSKSNFDSRGPKRKSSNRKSSGGGSGNFSNRGRSSGKKGHG